MNKKMTRLLRKIQTGKLERSFTLNRSDIDEENRTVPIAFSSEEPVERWFGNEVLSHDPSHVDLGRMNDGGALLVDHDPTDHVGTIEEAVIDTDHIGRAIVRFGRSARAQEIFNDVLDGIRKHISVGYRITEMTEDRETNTFTATRWTPHEVSFVSIPADASVGVMRNDSSDNDHDTNVIYFEERTMPKLFDAEGNVVDAEGNI